MKRQVALGDKRSIARSTTMWASHPISARKLGGSAQALSCPSTFSAIVVVVVGKIQAESIVVSITTRVDVLFLKAWQLQCHLCMNAPARASNYVASKPSQLKTYHKNRAVDMGNHNPPVHFARMPPDTCERLGWNLTKVSRQ
eukprot:6190512-Pleurochrysis_carterae.AAC.2